MRADDCRRYYEAIHLHHKKNKGTKSGKEGIYLKRTTLFACANDCRCYYETIHLHTIKTTKAHMSWDETIYLKRKKIAHANDGRCYYETIQLHPTKTTKAQNSWEDTIYRKLKKSCVATMKTIRLHEKKQQQRRTCPGTKRFILNEKIAHANKLPSLL